MNTNSKIQVVKKCEIINKHVTKYNTIVINIKICLKNLKLKLDFFVFIYKFLILKINNNYRVKVLKQADFDDLVTKHIDKFYFISFLQKRPHIQKLHKKISKCINSYNLHSFIIKYDYNRIKPVKKINFPIFHNKEYINCNDYDNDSDDIKKFLSKL